MPVINLGLKAPYIFLLNLLYFCHPMRKICLFKSTCPKMKIRNTCNRPEWHQTSHLMSADSSQPPVTWETPTEICWAHLTKIQPRSAEFQKSRKNKFYCFNPLSLGLKHYIAIANWNKLILEVECCLIKTSNICHWLWNIGAGVGCKNSEEIIIRGWKNGGQCYVVLIA